MRTKKKEENKSHINHRQKSDWSLGFMENRNLANGTLKRKPERRQ